MRRFLTAAAMLLLLPSAARAEWKQAVSSNFIVYSEGSGKQLEKIVTNLEKYYFMLRTVSNVKAQPSPLKVKVYLLRNADAVGEKLPGAPSGVGGYYEARPRGVMAVGTRMDTGGEEGLGAQEVLFHELAHHFMNQYFPAAYPAWYSEGFADYYGTTRILDNDVIEVGHPVRNRYLSFRENRWLPLEKLLTAKNYGDVASELDLLYAEGWALVHYLSQSKERKGQLRAYLTALNAGASYGEATDKAFGPGAKKLNSELIDYTSRRRLMALALPFKPIAVEPIAIRSLTAAEDALIDYDIALGTGILKRQAAAFAVNVRKAAARFPNDPYALQLLAEAERAAGNNAAVAAAVERWLAAAPGDALALMHKGEAQVEALRAAGSTDARAWDAARQPILAAIRKAPKTPQILLAYYNSFRAQGVQPPVGAQNGLFAAYELLPQDTMLRYLLASAYEERGMIEDAIAIIKPVAFELYGNEEDPRRRKRQEETRERYREVGDERTETAREMLDRLEKKLAAR